ncbi:MAG TPA: hypothetical protein VFX17_04070 [Patescibacteria group bacterium]|nr:hypothetical protein [Patescibacteria group bacterium]
MTISAHENFRKPKITVLRTNLCLLAIILAMGAVYVYGTISMATENFNTKKLSAQISDLEDQHQKLELQNSSLQSVSTLQAESVQLDFVPAGKITYLKADNVALNK